MNVTLARITASIAAGTLSGIVGAYFATRLFTPRTTGFLQVQKLEVLDTQRRVRAVLSAGDGKVSLRMFSTLAAPILELGVSDGSDARGELTIYSDRGEHAVSLRSVEKSRGVLTFSSEITPDQVSVGYSRVGDVDDGHDLGAWGLRVSGPNHDARGLFVFSKDGKLQGFTLPLEAPRPLLAK